MSQRIFPYQYYSLYSQHRLSRYYTICQNLLEVVYNFAHSYCFSMVQLSKDSDQHLVELSPHNLSIYRTLTRSKLNCGCFFSTLFFLKLEKKINYIFFVEEILWALCPAIEIEFN